MDKDTRGVMFSSKTGVWATPQDFYDKLDRLYGPFTLDPCANAENAKTANYFTEADDGLAQDWSGNVVFCNPPYNNMKDWSKKCRDEALKSDTTVVLLCPARTDTRYFHDSIMFADEIFFIKGRLKFGGSKNSAPFPSMVAVFRGSPPPKISTMER